MLSPQLQIDRLEFIVQVQTTRIEQQEAKIGELRTEIQRLIDWIADGSLNYSNGNGSAVQALVEIMQDGSLAMRRRIRAAETIVGYKAPEPVVELCKAFLASVFLDADADVDHKLDATELMRKLEAPRVMPGIERIVPPRDDAVDPEVERAKREEVMARRRAHLARQSALDAAELEKQRAARLAASNGE
jgi:hypothetical protein